LNFFYSIFSGALLTGSRNNFVVLHLRV